VVDHNTEAEELTHINVWGKYSISSINGFQYYLLMVNNTSQFVTIEFLKSKDQAAQKVKSYFTHHKVQGRMPKVIHIDHGHEFVNDSLL